jgi:hypothetical protein
VTTDYTIRRYRFRPHYRTLRRKKAVINTGTSVDGLLHLLRRELRWMLQQ